MPSTTIEVCHRYTRDEEIALMNAVHSALVEGFRIPANDKSVRLFVHEPHRMMAPPDRAQPERFTVVTVAAFAGRSIDAKRALYKAIVRNLEPLGIPKTQVKIVVHDVPRENWGIRGGQAGCDVEIGFKVEV